jgi:hypothetical protein
VGEMTMIERVKESVRSYEVMRHNLEWRVVRLSGFGDIRFRSKVFDEAQAICDELNARAAIEAMREPSEAMKRAASVNGDWGRGIKGRPWVDETASYQAMIEAALKEAGS